jgi:phage/conjugal plasmid C-4 type zinc finger TraR family protein
MDDADFAGQMVDREIEAVLLRHRAAAGVPGTQIPPGVARECIDCGDPISRRRLESVPGATRCHECQSDLERWERATKRSGNADDA